jgi:leucyl-tRNA synthetase
MQQQYDSLSIESAMQERWKNDNLFTTEEDLNREKFYCLSMLPYPSGELHMGHVRNYTIGDAISRYQRAQGKNVFQPMGWDAFGLPAENAAIKHNVSPHDWTIKNIKTMKKVFDALGFSFNWDREVKTCEPDYYRWEQWLFLQMYKKGLAYQKESMVNWDPVDNTVLANEQVVDGRGWRSGALVEKKLLKQWFLKITDYAQELLDDIDCLNGWPIQVRTMQRNWIGRSEGYEIPFKVVGQKEVLTVFTTRLETIFGVSFIAISSEHPLAKLAMQEDKSLASAVKKLMQHDVSESTVATLKPDGVLTSFKATNPLSRKQIPIWICNYVLSDYGTGALMGVPAHDTRDHAFALSKDLPILPVIHTKESWDYEKEAFTGTGALIHSGEFDGLSPFQAIKAIMSHLATEGKCEKKIQFRLRDWGISRQRYWGAPIPMVHCKHCGVVPVDEKDLPVVLPTHLIPDGKTNPLKECPEFYKTLCPQCGKTATRETDTMDTFVESSWYFVRYACPDQNKQILDERAKYWAPVDQYIGGVEHAVLHLLYARFFYKVLRDLGFVHGKEPFKNLLTQGMVLKDGHKMSKSKGNTVSPTDLIKQYGADTVRLFILFAAPPSQSLEWSDSSVAGCSRYLNKLWNFCQEHQAQLIATNQKNELAQFDFDTLEPDLKKIRSSMHQLLDQANRDFERHQFNTLVAACMKLLNLLQELSSSSPSAQILQLEGVKILLQLLSPLTPHIAEKIWMDLGFKNSLQKTIWPQASTHAMQQDSHEWVVQVNGKIRGHLQCPVDIKQEMIIEQAMTLESVQKYLYNVDIIKTVVVKNKLVNFVVKSQ